MKQSRHPWLPLLMILAVAGSLSLSIYYSYSLAERMVERYTPLIDATMELKLEATTAHLWFEEILSEDRDATMEEVRRHLSLAEWYADAMLHGGVNEEGRFIPLEDSALRIHIRQVRERLLKFSVLMDERWEYSLDAGPGSHYDGEFDQVFAEFIEEADLVETRLQQLTAGAMVEFRNTQLALLLITVLTSTGMLYSLIAYNRRRHEQVVVMDAANRELRTEMELRKRAEEVLKRQASTDMLTGLFNRRHMSDLLHQEIARGKRYGTSLSVVMLDIDHFKKINDVYGHDQGDEVLKGVAKRLVEALRENDRFARWGGEEFLILLPGTQMDGALELAERCRELFCAEPFDEVGSVSASFGVALYDGAESMRELLQRADAALYRAKAAGRNRVEAA